MSAGGFLESSVCDSSFLVGVVMNRFDTTDCFLCGLIALSALLGVFYCFQLGTSVSLLSAATESPGGFAVVELFNSEDASAGAAADVLLGKLVAEEERTGLSVYCMTYHVDSLDHQGWADPFSETGFTERHLSYSRRLEAKGDLPQMIVNGTRRVFEAQRTDAVQAISQALTQVAPVSLQVKAVATGRDVQVNCQVQNAPPEAELIVVWVEPTVTSTPDRGPNQGSQFKHVNVVRDLRSVALNPQFEGKVTLRRPNQHTGTVIAFVQEPGHGRILGAASTMVDE